MYGDETGCSRSSTVKLVNVSKCSSFLGPSIAFDSKI